MPYVGGLSRFPLSAVGNPPETPLPSVTDGVAGIPELGGDPGVKAVLVKPPESPLMDPVGHLTTKLEIKTPVINGPGPVGGQEDSLIRVCNEVIETPLSRLQVDIGHSDEGYPVPPFCSHRS